MPELFFESIDQIPEGLREIAKTDDEGKVVINVVAKAKLDEFRDTNVSIVKERDEYANQLEKARTLLGTEDFEEAEKNLGELHSIANRVKDGQLVENKGLEDALADRTKQMKESMQEEISAKAKEAKAWQEKYQAKDQTLRRTYVDRAITDAVIDEESGVYPKALSDILQRAYGVFDVSDEGKLTAKNGDAIMYGADAATPMSPKEWVSSLKESAPYFFKNSQGGGSGGGDGDTIQGMTQAEINKMSPEQRLAIANKEFNS